MSHYSSMLAGIVSLGVLSGAALGANEITVEKKIGGVWTALGTFNAATDFTVNVGTVGSSDVYVRIYDNNVGTLDSIGKVTITGTSGSGSGRLKVAVWRDFTLDFPLFPENNITNRGAASWAGLAFNDPGSGFDTNLALLKRTDLAASIRDDLTGNIDVGRVFTLQVNGTLQGDGSGVGGNIDGQVRSWEEDVFAASPAFDDPPSTASIEYVRAGNRITKMIIAGDTDASAEGYNGSGYDTIEEQLLTQLAYVKGGWAGRGASIRRLVIGPSTKAEGIHTAGGLDASTGRIYRVTTTGPIGDTSFSPNITAGFGAYTIRMTDESGTQVTNPNGHDFKMSVQAAKHFNGANILGNPHFFAEYSVWTGAINLIETKGNVTGPIKAANITGHGTETMRRDAHGHSGIICGGALENVTVDFNVYYANLLADYVNTVTIRRALVGAVVAYGTGGGGSGFSAGSGDILDLQVGGTPFTPESDPYPWIGQGFIGCDVAPMAMGPGYGPDPTTGVTAWGYDADRWVYRAGGDTGCDTDPNTGAAVDSVIRAEARVVKSGIYFMTQRLGTCGPEKEEKRIAAYRPRVETPVFHYSILGVMEAGVAWSGRLNYAGSTLANVRDDDYMRTAGGSSTHIHTIGPAADLWWVSSLEGTPLNRDLFIEGQLHDPHGIDHAGVLGELHMPNLPTEANVRVASGIGDINDADAIGTEYDPIASTEDSPRGRHVLSSASSAIEPSHVDRGIINVNSNPGTTVTAGQGGLNGQITLRATVGSETPARATRADYWLGQVIVGDPYATTPVLVVLDPATNTPPTDHQPYEYARLASAIGEDTGFGSDNGGAVGVAPFELHYSDCLPPTVGSFDTPPAVADVGVVYAAGWFAGGEAIRSRFYGPVVSGPGGDGEPVDVEMSPSGTFSGDITVVTGNFGFAVLEDAAAGMQDRDIILTPVCDGEFNPVAIYRVVRAQDSADPESSGQLLGTWPNCPAEDVEEFAHYFRLVCSWADIGVQGGTPGQDGLLNNNDFIVFINWHFANDPRADVGVQGGIPGSDQLWNNNDYVVFINWFFGDAHLCQGPEVSMMHTCEGLRMGGEGAQGEGDSDGGAGMEAVRAALQAAIEAMPAGERRSQMEQLLHELQNP